MTLKAIEMVVKTFEITVVDPLTDVEDQWLEARAVDNDYDCSVNQSGRIVLIEGPETIYELIEFLGEHEFLHDIGLIREIVQYEPQYESEMLIEVEFE